MCVCFSYDPSYTYHHSIGILSDEQKVNESYELVPVRLSYLIRVRVSSFPTSPRDCFLVRQVERVQTIRNKDFESSKCSNKHRTSGQIKIEHVTWPFKPRLRGTRASEGLARGQLAKLHFWKSRQVFPYQSNSQNFFKFYCHFLGRRERGVFSVPLAFAKKFSSFAHWLKNGGVLRGSGRGGLTLNP